MNPENVTLVPLFNFDKFKVWLPGTVRSLMMIDVQAAVAAARAEYAVTVHEDVLLDDDALVVSWPSTTGLNADSTNSHNSGVSAYDVRERCASLLQQSLAAYQSFSL